MGAIEKGVTESQQCFLLYRNPDTRQKNLLVYAAEGKQRACLENVFCEQNIVSSSDRPELAHGWDDDKKPSYEKMHASPLKLVDLLEKSVNIADDGVRIVRFLVKETGRGTYTPVELAESINTIASYVAHAVCGKAIEDAVSSGEYGPGSVVQNAFEHVHAAFIHEHLARACTFYFRAGLEQIASGLLAEYAKGESIYDFMAAFQEKKANGAVRFPTMPSSYVLIREECDEQPDKSLAAQEVPYMLLTERNACERNNPAATPVKEAAVSVAHDFADALQGELSIPVLAMRLRGVLQHKNTTDPDSVILRVHEEFMDHERSDLAASFLRTAFQGRSH